MTTVGDRDIERRLARLEALEQAPRPSSPFWRNTAAVGLLGAAVAAIPASLSAVHEYFQTEREVRLSQEKYQHERTISYLDRVLSPQTEEAKQAQVFRFLIQLPEKDPIRLWAQGELAIVEQTITKLKEEVDVRRRRVERKEAAIDEELEQVSQAVANVPKGDPVEPLLSATRISVEEKNRVLARERLVIADLETRSGLAPAPSVEEVVVPSIGSVIAPSLWKNRIAITSTLEQARAIADKARRKGAQPEIRKHGGQFSVFVGAYGTEAQAVAAHAEARAYLNRPVAVINVAQWCSSGTMSVDYIDCDP